MIETTMKKTVEKFSALKDCLVTFAAAGAGIGAAHIHSPDATIGLIGGAVGLSVGLLHYFDTGKKVLAGDYDKQKSNQELLKLRGITILHKALLKEAAIDSLIIGAVVGVATYGAAFGGFSLANVSSDILGPTGSFMVAGGLFGLALANIEAKFGNIMKENSLEKDGINQVSSAANNGTNNGTNDSTINNSTINNNTIESKVIGGDRLKGKIGNIRADHGANKKDIHIDTTTSREKMKF